MSENKHYKCYFKSSVLNDGDFDRDKDTIVKILSVQEMRIETRDGPQTQLCALLEGYEKPFRIISTIGKNITKALKSPMITDWHNKHVSVYIHVGLKAFGDIHDVPRVRPVAPRVQVVAPASLDQIAAIRVGFARIKQDEKEYCQKAKLAKLEDIKQDKANTVINWLKGQS